MTEHARLSCAQILTADWLSSALSTADCAVVRESPHTLLVAVEGTTSEELAVELRFYLAAVGVADGAVAVTVAVRERVAHA